MFREGLGERSSFGEYHPVVNLTYYLLAIGVTVFSLSPWFLLITFSLAWVYALLLRGFASVRMNLIFVLWIIVVMAVINVLFTHKGETVLFFLNGNRITAEALAFGLSAAVMLSAVLIWFTSFNVIMTAEKLIYIFGRAAPVLGLTLSMIFRYVPLLKERYEEIRMGQMCMGRAGAPAGADAGTRAAGAETRAADAGTRAADAETGTAGEQTPKRKRRKAAPGLFRKIRQGGKNVSVLISWSLESSIENADSMEARGYGLKGRTSFHLYRFTARDALMEVWLCGLGAVSVAGCALGKTEVFFYPRYVLHPFDAGAAVTLVAFAVLLATPILLDLIGERKWKRSDLTI